MSTTVAENHMDPYVAQGMITVEYYDGSSDFSESEDDYTVQINPRSATNPSTPYYSISSNQNSREAVTFKTYDFKHSDTEKDCSDSEFDGLNKIQLKYVSEKARLAVEDQYTITQEELMKSLLHPKASFPRCPRGGFAEPYSRRSYAGPFLTCPFNHECGDDFSKILISTKPSPEVCWSTRPVHLKEKKARFFKQCKHCELTAFTHHRNPTQHYEDYLNNVTHKQHQSHTRVWPQNLADLKHAVEEIEIFDSETAAKCKNYEPSSTLLHAKKYAPNFRKRRTAVITRRRPVIPRVVRRISKSSVSKAASTTPTTNNFQLRLPEESKQKEFTTVVNSKNSLERRFRNASSNSQGASTENTESEPKSSVQSMQSSTSSLSEVNNVKTDPINLLNRRFREPVTRLINARQASSNISKRFVRKPKPPQEAKYIQKLKPNISAKFLRASSKNRQHLSASHSMQKQNADTIVKVLKKPNQASMRASRRKNVKFLNDDSDSSENGSYAKYRDKNGEFDPEKYRQSILKMLVNSGGDSRSERRRRKRSFRKNSTAVNLRALPKVKNLYENVKSKVSSNVPQRRRRRYRKSNSESAFDLSDFSLKSKYSSDTVIDVKDSYFSIPSLDI